MINLKKDYKMNFMYYCIISIIVLIGLLFYINIKHSKELDDFADSFGIYLICILISLTWPAGLIMLIFGSFVYFLNLSVRKIIDILNLK
jgi:hypothetical protein